MRPATLSWGGASLSLGHGAERPSVPLAVLAMATLTAAGIRTLAALMPAGAPGLFALVAATFVGSAAWLTASLFAEPRPRAAANDNAWQRPLPYLP